MATLNKVMMIGNLTRDPECRYTPKGSAVADWGMAVNRSYTNDAGEKLQETTFVDVVAWGRLAEIVAKHLLKGAQVFVEGRLQTDTWVDKDTGKPRTKLKVVTDNVQFLTARAPADDAAPRATPRQPSPEPAAVGVEGDEITF